jgi:hypothetical protein
MLPDDYRNPDCRSCGRRMRLAEHMPAEENLPACAVFMCDTCKAQVTLEITALKPS